MIWRKKMLVILFYLNFDHCKYLASFLAMQLMNKLNACFIVYQFQSTQNIAHCLSRSQINKCLSTTKAQYYSNSKPIGRARNNGVGSNCIINCKPTCQRCDFAFDLASSSDNMTKPGPAPLRWSNVPWWTCPPPPLDVHKYYHVRGREEKCGQSRARVAASKFN